MTLHDTQKYEDEIQMKKFKQEQKQKNLKQFYDRQVKEKAANKSFEKVKKNRDH